MKILALILTIAGVTAQADILKGTYTGVTDTGDLCAMASNGKSFVDGVHHPLTERFALEVDGVAFAAGHPASVDLISGEVIFTHEIVQGINATSDGAVALVVTMVHSEAFDGPTEFTLINDNWRKKTKTVKRCSQLKFTL